MNVDEYRKNYANELAKSAAKRAPSRAAAAGSAGPRGTKDLTAIVKAKGNAPARRIAAIDEVGDGAVTKPSVMKVLISVLADPSDDPAVRLSALGVLQQSSFSVTDFRRYAADYREALRGAATDARAKVRERVMEILALQRDEYAQRLLIDGLQDPKLALVKPQRALQMIGYDLHAEQFGLLRNIVATSKRPGVRRTALRLLAADSDSKDLFDGIAGDKNEDHEARATSAIALQSLAPERFEAIARNVVLDDDDNDNVRATFLNALSHGSTTASDHDFDAGVRAVQAATPSKQLHRAARQFIRSTGKES